MKINFDTRAELEWTEEARAALLGDPREGNYTSFTGSRWSSSPRPTSAGGTADERDHRHSSACPAGEEHRTGPGGHPCQGLYHTPAGDPAPKTAFIAAHYNVDFSEHYLAEPIAARGYGFLGWNTRFRGNEGYFLLDVALADIALGVRWLREHGAERIVLLGNSGGGSLMAAYQALGEGGGELYISLAAHPGRPQVLTAWMDASVTDETRPARDRPLTRPVQPRERPALRRRLGGALSRRPNGTQPPDHRVGQG